MNRVVIDIETKNTFWDVKESNPAALDISFAGIYQESLDKFRGFFEDKLSDLWPILESADEIIGYNTLSFDYPVLSKYYSGNLFKFKNTDMLRVIEFSIGKRVKLDSVARATLGAGKIGNGLDAIKYYRNKEFDKLEKYCLEDVRITWEVYKRAKESGHLAYVNKDGNIQDFIVNWQPAQKVDSGQQSLWS